MKTLTLIRGLDGTGKTTIARRLTRWHPLKRAIASDDYPGRYLPNGSLNPAIAPITPHLWVLERVIEWMNSPLINEIVVHNTFVKLQYMDRLITLAQERGWIVHVIRCEAIVYPNGDRAESVHGVPKEVHDRWIVEFEDFR